MTRILHCLTFIFGVLLLSCPASAQPAAGGKVVFEVTDSLHTPLAYATIALKAHADGKMYAATTGLDGKCVFTLPADMYDAGITFVGYEPRHMSVAAVEARDQYHTVRLRVASVSIQDVVVTASESKGVTSSSVIDRKAMEHIQPSSFAALLALLPGGSSSSPVLSAPNTIHLREIGISNDDYATSSLGTSFVIDGAPMRNDANMQYIPGADQLLERKLFINKGVDMRSISTDEIQHVEIVRGIPSVEYGDLTSGLVKIERKRGGKALTARFKADMDSKLFSVGKGFEIPDRGLTVNIGADLLDSKADPRNKLENYKRMTGSLRIHKTWDASPDHTLALGTNLDYTGSFDNRKVDPESNNGNLDDFKSKYNRFALSVGFDYTSKKEGFFRSFEATASVDYSRDRIERRKFMQVTRPTAVPNSLAPGEHDAQFLEASYIADLTVDGQPLNAYAKALATFGVKTAATSSTIVAGADWALDKNLGRGQVYDMLHPLSSDAATRPRAYSDIPAQHDLGLFVEDNTTVALGRSRLEVMAGVRATTMLNLSREYALRGRFYFDPRFNARFAFPALKLGRRTLETAVSGGVGWHTKTPTMDQLYPAPLYYDFQQLNYYHANPAFRRINMVTYVVDPTNYSLGAARNFKWEVRGDVTLDGNRFSLTYFEEDMKSGFRTANRYASYTRKQYDYSGVDDSQLEGPPSLEGMPYTVDTLVRAAGVATNGSRTRKRGVEFTFSSQRIESLRTRLTVTGAWFRTEYGNSDPVYENPGTVINGKPYVYTGIYASDGNYIREMWHTNFMVDTDIPRLGLGFSFTFQCRWHYRQYNGAKSSRPFAYFGPDGVVRDYTDESAADPYLKWLVRSYNQAAFRWENIPFYMTTNLKVTKKLFREKVMVAMFITQMFNYMPSYKIDGVRVRRHASPYFGMEVNFRL